MEYFVFALVCGASLLLVGVIMFNIPHKMGTRYSKVSEKLSFGLLFLGAVIIASTLVVYGILK